MINPKASKQYISIGAAYIIRQVLLLRSYYLVELATEGKTSPVHSATKAPKAYDRLKTTALEDTYWLGI